MQRKERISSGGAGDTQVQDPTPPRTSATTKKTSLVANNFTTQRLGSVRTAAPILGSPSEFQREAWLRGVKLGPSRPVTHRVSQGGDSSQKKTSQDGDSSQRDSIEKKSSVPRLPPIPSSERLSSGSTAPAHCGPCSGWSRAPGHSVLKELAKECRLENRNPNLYRLATPLEISRIPEHLRNLRIIPLEGVEGDGGYESVDETPPSPPPEYYPPQPEKKKKGRSNRAYWRWEKPSKRVTPKPPPSACRILEDLRRARRCTSGSQESILTLFPPPPPPPPSVVDIEEDGSESEEEEEPGFQFEIVKEPPTIPEAPLKPPPPPPPPDPADPCAPPLKEIPEIAGEEDLDAHGEPFNIPHGPKLLIKAKYTEILLRQQDDEEIGETTKLFIETFDDFAATTKCMETRQISLINEGTTAIRFQWIRAPPGRAPQKLLRNPTKVMEFGKPVRKRQFPMAVQQGAKEAFQQECGEIKSGPRKFGIHLGTSRKINPALTRTIKILKHTVASGAGFQNLLLLLSLRVPRLKRELIRRTQLQLSSRTLSSRFQHLYLQLRNQRRVRCHDLQSSHRHSQRPYSPQSEEYIKELCTCNVSLESDSSDSYQSDASDNFSLFPEKYLPECVCVRPHSPPPPSSIETLWGPEDISSGSSRDIRPEDDDLCRPFPRPPFQCTCEGICICQPPAEDQGLCVCGPCCICTLNLSLDRWPEIPGEGTTCKCVGPCACVVEEDKPCPTTPPPSARKASLATICECDEPCDCDLPPGDCTCHLTKSACDCDLPPGDCQCHLSKSACDCDLPPGDCQCHLSKSACDCDLPPGDCQCHLTGSACDCDPPPDDELCTCGPTCPCITPPSSCSDFCACQPVCICDPPPEDLCNCRPFCTCVSPLPSKDCIRAELDPEDGACACPSCKCLTAGEQGMMGEGDGPSPEAEEVKVLYKGHFRTCSKSELGEDGGEDCRPVFPPPTFQVPAQKIPKVHPTRKIGFVWEPCHEFIFCELPRTILPGQKSKFEIMFRPKSPGIYTETIHLLTHPRLDATAYAIRLQGLCINPEIPTEHCKEEDPEPCSDPSTLTKSIYSQMYEQQGRRALDAIMDHVLHFHKKQKSTVPFGRVTIETLFRAHNPRFYYYQETGDRALHIVRTLVQLLVASTNVIGNPEFCQRDIKKLYYEILKSPAIQDYFPANLNSDQVEELLQELNKCTDKLLQPPVFQGVSAEERGRTGTDAAVDSMIDEIMDVFESIEQTSRNPFQMYIWRKVMRGRLEAARDHEIEQLLELRRQEGGAQRQVRKLDIATQTTSQEALAPEEEPTAQDEEETPQVTNEAVEEQMQEMLGKSIHEYRHNALHDILNSSIERMLSFLDATANIHDYERQHVIFHGPGSGQDGQGDDDMEFCC